MFDTSSNVILIFEQCEAFALDPEWIFLAVSLKQSTNKNKVQPLK